MNINLGELSNRKRIEINEVVSFDENYLNNSKIKKLNDVKVDGYVWQNDLDEYKCYLNVSGQMFLEDSITLEEIPYDFNFLIDDVIDDSYEKNANLLDIMELLWQNIVLEVPIRYTKSDADNLKGDNWKVISDANKEEEIDPRMQKLYDLYNKGGE